MRTLFTALLGVAAVLAATAVAATALADHGGPGASLDGEPTTVFTSGLGLEGLTGDDEGNLYSTGRGGNPCPVYRVPAAGGPADVVGNVPAPCSPSGITFGPDGRLYIADDDQVLVVAPNADAPPTAAVHASGVPGTNGLAFDRNGDLWTGDGTTGQGRVWRIAPDGVVTEVFRIQPTVNGVGVGREARTLPPGGAQSLVANGIVFERDGTMIVADTARGALWRIEPHRGFATGCDTTFRANTLCLGQVWVQHPALEGADGIALDRAGNVWVAANERNALVVVRRNGAVREVFRNPPDAATKLRNGGPLEFPTSPFLLDRALCVASSDGNRRDNSPNAAGELRSGTAAVGKISCAPLRR